LFVTLINLIYLFVSRHEVHSMNTYSAERRSIKTDKKGIEACGITGLQTLFATALKTEP